MITQIRKNVFETNSSSSHVLVVDTNIKERPDFELTKNIKMTIPEVDYEGSYGNGDILDDFESKLKYAEDHILQCSSHHEVCENRCCRAKSGKKEIFYTIDHFCISFFN